MGNWKYASLELLYIYELAATFKKLEYLRRQIMKDVKDFKDELLEYLFTHRHDYVKIKHITDNYYTDDALDKDNIIRRGDIISTLHELKDMKWIELISHISNSVVRNQDTQKDEFIKNNPIKVKMTIHGENEYQRLKHIQQPTVDNSIKIQGDFKGNFNRDNYGSISQATTHNKDNNQKENRKNIEKIWNLFTENKLISSLLFALIIWIVTLSYNKYNFPSQAKDNKIISDTTLKNDY